MKRTKARTALPTPSGFRFPVTFYYPSPVVILAGVSEGIVTGSFVVFGVLFLSALVFGRAFCGWVSPGGAIALSRASRGLESPRRSADRWQVAGMRDGEPLGACHSEPGGLGDLHLA